MAPFVHLAITNDDLTGTTGTVWNDAYETTRDTALNAFFQPLPASSTITTTGNITALPLPTGAGPLVIYMNNATLATIQGIAAGLANQELSIFSIGAGQVDASHQDAAATAANRVINIATSGKTSLAAATGQMKYVYDATTARWRLQSHEQGAWITPTFAGGNFTSSGGTWTVDSGDVAEFKYKLSGRSLSVRWNLSTTTIGAGTTTNLNIANGQFGGFTSAATAQYGSHDYSDNAGTHAIGRCFALSSVITLQKVDVSNWAVATNATLTFGAITFEVQ